MDISSDLMMLLRNLSSEDAPRTGFRATEFCKPLPQFILSRMHAPAEGTFDAFSRELGTAMHARIRSAIELAQRRGSYRYENGERETRIFNGQAITGEPDALLHGEDGNITLLDFKVTSGYGFGKEFDPAHQLQLSIYAWLMAEERPVTDAAIVKIAKDWGPGRGPAEPFEITTVPLLPAIKVELHIGYYLNALWAAQERGLGTAFGCAQEERTRFNGRLEGAQRCERYCSWNHACPLYQSGAHTNPGGGVTPVMLGL